MKKYQPKNNQISFFDTTLLLGAACLFLAGGSFTYYFLPLVIYPLIYIDMKKNTEKLSLIEHYRWKLALFSVFLQAINQYFLLSVFPTASALLSAVSILSILPCFIPACIHLHQAFKNRAQYARLDGVALIALSFLALAHLATMVSMTMIGISSTLPFFSPLFSFLNNGFIHFLFTSICFSCAGIRRMHHDPKPEDYKILQIISPLTKEELPFFKGLIKHFSSKNKQNTPVIQKETLISKNL